MCGGGGGILRPPNWAQFWPQTLKLSKIKTFQGLKNAKNVFKTFKDLGKHPAYSPDVGLHSHTSPLQGGVHRQVHRVLTLAGVVLVDEHRVFCHVGTGRVPGGEEKAVSI